MSSQLLELPTDLNDAGEIFKLFMLLKDFNETNKGVHNRALREAVQKIWQEKRFPKPSCTHNKPHAFPWTLEARNAYFENRTRSALVLEHIIPMKQVAESLMGKIRSGVIVNPENMLNELLSIHNGVRFIVIHKTDDQLLRNAGVQSSGGDESDPYSRYRTAGIDLASMMPLTQDERYPG